VHLLKPANQRRLAALYQRALAALFRGKFLSGLSQILDEEGFASARLGHRRHAPVDSDLLYAKRWVLYAKRPFGGPHQSYLSRYTHRAALRTDALSPSMRSGGPSPSPIATTCTVHSSRS
jgi:hypothetical protein